MSIYRANDKYRAKLRSTWIADPAATSLLVTAVPDNVPTIVTLGWETALETTFFVTGKSGDSPSNYALTGVTRLRGANQNLPENTAVNCLNNEEFFNQYSDFVNDEYLQMAEQASPPGTPASGFLRLYAGTDGKWHVKNDAGVVADIGQLSDEWIDVAYDTTMNFDLGNGLTNKLKFLCGALTGNPTFTISNAAEGMVFLIRIVQDGDGSRIPVWFNTTTDTVTMTIANPCVVTTTKDIKTGTPVKFSTTGALPTGLVAGTQYYWIRTGATTGNLAATRDAAIAGTTITTTGSQSGTHTMSVGINWAGGEVAELSTEKYAWDDVIFIVHSLTQVTGVLAAKGM